MVKSAFRQSSVEAESITQEGPGCELPRDFEPDAERRPEDCWRISIEQTVVSLTQVLEEEQLSRQLQQYSTALEYIMAVDKLRGNQVVKGNTRFPDGEFYALAYAIRYPEEFARMTAAANWEKRQKECHAQALEEYKAFTLTDVFPPHALFTQKRWRGRCHAASHPFEDRRTSTPPKAAITSL